MQKLVIFRIKELRIKSTQTVIRRETQIGEVIGQPEVIQDMMTNDYFIACWQEIGATHWQLTEVLNGVRLEELPPNFYNKTYYHTEE